MRIHFIAIGGSAMHNLALALNQKGYIISGSDDEIFEPSKTRLRKHGLLPEAEGWFPEKIKPELDAVILGMHARADNPELLKAKEIGLKIYSYPEYIYEQTKNKTRVVIGGSHGKTTITAMVLHVLHQNKVDCDYMVGAQLEGFDTMVRLSHEAKIAIIEGDEYLSSPIDRRPKFHLYKPNIALLSGIAWDHINVFPTFKNYVEQFEIFINQIEKPGSLIYCETDSEVKRISESGPEGLKKIPYNLPEYHITEGTTIIIDGEKNIPLQVFGGHNLLNLNGARLICAELGISKEDFYHAISSFKGASRRLELIEKNNRTAIYKDFAHSPSKLKATTEAVKNQFPDRKLFACMELHTFSSLNEEFLELYKGAMEAADEALIYFNPKTLEHKKLKPITTKQVKQAFGGGKNITVYTDSNNLINYLLTRNWDKKNLLLMSSGTFDGLDFEALASTILNDGLK
jgi:UDP-N-acetylmuramate: L-alanyl-gamma-D-glutamyl-meso-diaminopimelate ligase